MSKLSVTCVECGFVEFVESTAWAEYGDWSVISLVPREGVCPACLKDKAAGIRPVRASAPVKQPSARPASLAARG